MSAALRVLVIARSFPRAILTTGLATSLGIGAALFGGTAQVVFTWLIRVTGSPLSPVLYVMALNVVAIVAIVLLGRAGEAEAPVVDPASLPAR